MADTKDGVRILRSWKEIAAYLGYDERTCARWEKTLGLPVRRAAGGPKSRVYVRQDELDAWVSRTFPGTGATSPAEPGRPSRSATRWAPYVLVPAAVLVAAVAIFGRRFAGHPGPSGIADFAIEDSVLVALDAQKKELWRFDTRLPNLEEEAVYRRHFKRRRVLAYKGYDLPHVQVLDLDGDRKRELLFATQTVDEMREGELIAFDGSGKELWRFRAGGEKPFGDKTFSSDYRIYGFQSEDLDGDGRPEIVVVSIHRPDWPCQIAVLEGDGTKVGEYWHSGHINDFVFTDFDGNGREEIAATGVNNEYQGAVVLLLDPLRLGGASPNTGEFRCRDCAPGTELALLRLPRADIDRMPRPDGTGTLLEAGATIDAKDEDRLMVGTLLSGLVFEFDAGLRPSVTLSNTFQELYGYQASFGRVPAKIDKPAYERALRAGVLYWTGSAWSRTPVPPRFSE